MTGAHRRTDESRAVICFTLNGRAVEAEPRAGMSLLELLREGFGLTSVKDGCAPEGSCGACTVLLDGRPVVSCAQPVERVDGRSVVTLEGLSPEIRESWARAFVTAGGAQCGFCTPGVVMKAEGLLARSPDPDRAEVVRALTGNLCRCTGYAKIVDAVRLAAAERRGNDMPAPGVEGGVGTSAPRYRGREIVLGEQLFVNDMRTPGMLWGAVRFSDHPRARVLRIDVSAAHALPRERPMTTRGPV